MSSQRRIRLRSVTPVITLLLCAVLPSTLAVASARSAPLDRWRVVKIIGAPTDFTYPAHFAATGPVDAWSWWTSCCRGSSVSAFLEHWNGTKWSMMKTPEAAQGILGLGASSRRDVWIFAMHTTARGTTNQAVIWNGRSWRVRKIPSWVLRLARPSGLDQVAPAVFGRSDVWVFGSGAYGAHYNGRNWVKQKLAVFAGEVSAVSARDIWVLGYMPNHSLRPSELLTHWDGTAWHTLSIPKPAHVPPQSFEYVSDLTATGPRNVWLARDILVGSNGAVTLNLMHWNGKRWHGVRFHYPTSFVDEIAQDGHGGLWLSSNGAAPGYHWYFDHLLRSGRWTRQVGPATATTRILQNSSLTWIPGTESMWATGSLIPLHNGNGVFGAFFKYGP